MSIRVFYIVVCFALLKGTFLASQEYKKFEDLIMDLQWGETDYVFKDSLMYLLNKSFLIDFDGYKNLYPEIGKSEVSFAEGGGSIDYDMNYTPFWLIRNDSIYLIGISLNSDRGRKNDGTVELEDQLPAERFLRMEKFVNKRFEKGDIPQVCAKLIRPGYSIGIMFASWVNGVYYIKQTKKYSQKSSDWLKSPNWRLTVKDGKIIKTETV
ncbi:MAG: hypothetical protein ACRC13_10450 [Tannerellaceae bacterium]